MTDDSAFLISIWLPFQLIDEDTTSNLYYNNYSLFSFYLDRIYLLVQMIYVYLKLIHDPTFIDL